MNQSYFFGKTDKKCMMKQMINYLLHFHIPNLVQVFYNVSQVEYPVTYDNSISLVRKHVIKSTFKPNYIVYYQRLVFCYTIS